VPTSGNVIPASIVSIESIQKPTYYRYEQALSIAQSSDYVSTIRLQRRMRVGYNEAKHYLHLMIDQEVIEPFYDNKDGDRNAVTKNALDFINWLFDSAISSSFYFFKRILGELVMPIVSFCCGVLIGSIFGSHIF
jgi:hypothetical protein